MTPELLLTLMVCALVLGLLSGFPVAFVLGGVSLIFALIGNGFGVFDLAYVSALPDRIFGIMGNDLLLAVPLFIFMGVMLEKAKIAEELLETMAELLGRWRAGMGLSVILVGALLAASTGIVGATVITMGLISLPVMLKAKYSPTIATGVICASGTLGQIIPPSIVLILLGDQISSAYQTAQMAQGNFAPVPVSVADLFVGALLPGLLLVGAYMAWMMAYGVLRPGNVPPARTRTRPIPEVLRQAVNVLLPPLLLIIVVLGSILGGFATATESASVGALGAMLLSAIRGRLHWRTLRHVAEETAKNTSMVFVILIGAAMFTLVFRGYGGDDMVHDLLSDLPGGLMGAMLVTMLVMFLLGFFLDFIEIIFVVVPIVAPVLFALGADPVWLAVLIAVNLQTSFLTPPFGFALFYLRGVAPEAVQTLQIYRGVVPFVGIQLLMLLVLAVLPQLATWLPEMMYGTDFSPSPLPEDLPLSPVESYGVDF